MRNGNIQNERSRQELVFPSPAAHPVVPQTGRRRHLRSLFLSDIHLGAKGSRPARLLDFLDHHHADTIYLVGDIFDNWRPIGSNWKPDHHMVLRAFLDRARQGVRIVYIPGNHDAFFRRYCGEKFERIEVVESTIHTTVDGARYLVTHGDCCDLFARRAPFFARLGSTMESALRSVEAAQNAVLRRIGRRERAVIEAAIRQANTMIRAHDRFEERLSALALAQGMDGIICGHFHQPALRSDFGATYANCGDWIEHCTAIAEGTDGGLRLINWQPAPTATEGWNATQELEGEHALAI